MKIKSFIAAVVIFFTTIGVLSAAGKPKQIGESGDWAAFTIDDSSGKVCYIVSQPKKALPTNVRRDPIFFLVTHRPGKDIRNEVSVITGYPYKKGSVTTATIGSDTFSMFTSNDGAWLEQASTEQRMVASMKNGASMVVKGLSSRGTVTTDTYSLSGVTATLDIIDNACKM